MVLEPIDQTIALVKAVATRPSLITTVQEALTIRTVVVVIFQVAAAEVVEA